jgi:hypothetical protein
MFMGRGRLALCVVLLAAATAGTGRAQSADTPALRVDARAGSDLQVLLTFAPDLPVPARIALIEEATEIWRATGVAINWQPGGSPCEPGRCVRTMVVRGRARERHDEARTVGELVRLEGGAAVVLVSVDEGERIVRAAPGQRPRFGLLEGDPLGTVLGRAVAHELGHYFLDTATHASRGLMRPRFEPGEFADLRSTAFALDSDAVAWLRARVMRGLPVGPSVLTMPAVVRAATAGRIERLTFAYRR